MDMVKRTRRNRVQHSIHLISTWLVRNTPSTKQIQCIPEHHNHSPPMRQL
jgi:hypothetical protein